MIASIERVLHTYIFSRFLRIILLITFEELLYLVDLLSKYDTFSKERCYITLLYFYFLQTIVIIELFTYKCNNP